MGTNSIIFLIPADWSIGWLPEEKKRRRAYLLRKSGGSLCANTHETWPRQQISSSPVSTFKFVAFYLWCISFSLLFSGAAVFGGENLLGGASE